MTHRACTRPLSLAIVIIFDYPSLFVCSGTSKSNLNLLHLLLRSPPEAIVDIAHVHVRLPDGERASRFALSQQISKGFLEM